MLSRLFASTSKEESGHVNDPWDPCELPVAFFPLYQELCNQKTVTAVLTQKIYKIWNIYN
jgi:hypothetical protein